jgi:3-hydroxyacyl-[acyl-carrier-protein] dehydratase
MKLYCGESGIIDIMNRPWHSVQNTTQTGSHDISAEATLDRDSLWFDGHFPGAPILPGIAQLAIVSDLLKRHAETQGRAVAISSLSRVRFRQFIRPDDTVAVTITQDGEDPSAFKFKLIVKGQAACSGQVRTAPCAG